MVAARVQQCERIARCLIGLARRLPSDWMGHIKGPFGTTPAPDSKRGSGGAVPNGYFFKLILV
jgi:hypothetical protein